ncbi:hypothetical protein EMPS_09979 [Entomortierella parvispora]|uniref:Chitin-binding type-3 domain-containing protein n=1 Tax=Entomortierella parvispora TaxID=205924 RepID=A0A9P3M141_9FUNG|nr:hypothetical protein EMPS_09979 [Entomortierella parvispora]
MHLLAAYASIASALTLACSALAATPVVGGYLLLDPVDGPSKLQALAQNAATVPINRLYLSFASPTLAYVPGSNTLQYVGLNYATSGDYGFADIKTKVAALQAGGVEVFLSVGGWDYGCFPYMYTYYSIASYGATDNSNYYEITDFGGLANCTIANQWCYTCEPQSAGTTLANFAVFPEPSYSSTWQAAQKYVIATAGGDYPVFHPNLNPGLQWTDTNNSMVVTVPGDNYFSTVNRDPYQDLVYLAKDLGLAGVDIDYEEMWHADYFRNGPSEGPWTNYQTVYKYSAIMKDVLLNIAAIDPTLKLSTAAAAAGGDSSDWWGGNLKDIWYYVFKFYPDLYNGIANSGGVNIMTYDLSDNESDYECPTPTACTLSEQVQYYMNTYSANGMSAQVGYEIGTPAYPDPTHDPTHQLPLIQSELTTILSTFGANGGFFWELYKPQGAPTNVEASSVAQQICKAALGSAARCSGTIPQPGGAVVSSTSAGTAPTSISATQPTTTVNPTKTTTAVASASPTSPPSSGCTAAAWSASTAYNGGAVVSYNGHQYTAQWWSQNNVPTAGAPWTDNGACSGSGGGSAPAPGSCGSTAAWSSTTAYNSGASVVYGGYIYTAQWWTQGDTPGSNSVWTKGNACSASMRRRRLYE